MKGHFETMEIQEHGNEFVTRKITRIVPDILEYADLNTEQIKEYMWLKEHFPLYSERALLIMVDR